MTPGSLAAGTRVGPYQVVGPLGSGGMGEVYRARDPRLSRDVAVKVLPQAVASDEERLRRFEVEARAAGSLNHPNLITVFDVGVAGGAPYVVFELLEGVTLRELLLEGGLSPRKIVAHGVQIARGLAAAHGSGILHRDLKPENLFVTKDGRVKILDFGLAKAVREETGTSSPETVTATLGTEEGVVVGTVGYMSPEQVRLRPLDHRTDIFSFGVVLYEMCTGRRPFTGASAADIVVAILREEPPSIATGEGAVSPALVRIIGRCLEKEPDERFQQASDLAFALEALSGMGSGPGPSALPVLPDRRRLAPLAGGLGLLLAGGALAMLLLPRRETTALLDYRRLTFRNGLVSAARFNPSGTEIVYSASWEGAPSEIFTTTPASSESRPLGIPKAKLLSISSTGELALLTNAQEGIVTRGTLARMPPAGQVPRELAFDVLDAAWNPKREELAVVRFEGDASRLEYPLGKVLVEALPPRWIGAVAVSPDGDLVAYVDHDVQRWDFQGAVAVVTRDGRARRLTKTLGTVTGLAFTARGDEVLFSGSDGQTAGGLFAVSLEGRLRAVTKAPDALVLLDAAADGRLLAMRDQFRNGVIVRSSADSRERDLSWLDGSWLRDVSDDGKTILFDEEGDGAGSRGGVFLRGTDGSPAVRLGDGHAIALSPDGRWALARERFASPPRFVLLPTGAGAARVVSTGDVELLEVGFFTPDSRRLVLMGARKGRPWGCFERSIEESGTLREIAPEGSTCRALSPDGSTLLARKAPEPWKLVSLADGTSRAVAGLLDKERPLRFSGDGSALFAVRGPAPRTITRIELATGARTPIGEIRPPAGAEAGISAIPSLSADGSVYGATWIRESSDLFLVSRPSAPR